MIEHFEEKILSIFGLEAEYFDSEYTQWVYKFRCKGLMLEFIYSLDGTISTSLYFNDDLVFFCFASGLVNLYMEDNKIYGDVISGKLKRKLEIDPLHIKVKWEDTFL